MFSRPVQCRCNAVARAPAMVWPPLDQRVRINSYRIDHPPDITDNSNATTAVAKSRGGHTMAVTFWMADPPAISFFTVVCSKPPDRYSKSSFRAVPHVVGAVGRFVLLRAEFFSRYCEDEFFVYKAGDGEPPSLEWVPHPYDEEFRPYSVREVGVVPSGQDGGQYLLAAICCSPSGYQLRIYSSERKSWSTRTLPNPCPGIQMVVPEKVITLGESLLGWVNFSRGLLMCDLSQDPPGVRFIPLPPPLPENREKLKVSKPEDSARCFRDLTCVNGVLKFIEIEHRVIPPETPDDPRSKELLCDSDMITWLEREYVNDKLKQPPKRDGWSAMTWTRTVSSSTDCWHKECDVDVADLLVDEAVRSSLSGLRGESETVKKLTFRDLYSTLPTLSIDGSNILYLKSMLEPDDPNVRVVSVDLENKTVKALGPYLFEDRPCKKTFRPCTLSHYLNMNPGTEVSVCHDLTIIQTGSSANGQDNTSIQVDKPIPRQVLSIPSGHALSGSCLRKATVHELKLKYYRENGLMSQDVPGNSSHVETTKKLQRLIVERKSHGQDRAQSIVQNMAPASCQVTGIKDSQKRRQSYAEEASCAHEPQIGLQSTDLSGGFSMQNKQACCDPHGLWPPLSRSCLPQSNINQLNGVGNRPNTQHLNPLYAASSTGSCVPHSPLHNINHWNRPDSHLHTQEVNHQSHWNGGGYHPRPHNFIQNQLNASNYNGYNFPWPNLPAYAGHFPRYASFHYPGVPLAGPSSGHAFVHQPGILPVAPSPGQVNVLQPAQAEYLHPEQWPARCPTQATPRKRWRGAG